MNFVNVYIQTFDSTGAYTGTFIDVTKDVDLSSIGNISQRLDNNTYDVGTFKYTDFSLSLRNVDGTYSDVGNLQSIFTDKRTDSIVKVVWSNTDYAMCGLAKCGNTVLPYETIVFYGLLNDRGSKQNIFDNKITFSVQGLESIFDTVETNYASLSVSNNVSVNIYTLLNQTRITNLITVSQTNITCGIDQLPDSVADLEATTVKEALDLFLESSNSILYVDVTTQTVYVKPRTADVSVSYTFYGQASDIGAENIIALKDISSGVNKVFNYWKWSNTTTTSVDTTSIDDYGVQKKELDISLFTNTTKRQNILDNFKTEFAYAKQELKVECILDYQTVVLFFMNRVAIDYPTVLYPFLTNGSLPFYGIDQYDSAYYPNEIWSLTLTTSTNFKIMGRIIDLKNGKVTLELREI